MTTFLWILGGGIVMSAIALVGSTTLLLSEATLRRILLPLVAFAAGSLIGGAFLMDVRLGIIGGRARGAAGAGRLRRAGRARSARD